MLRRGLLVTLTMTIVAAGCDDDDESPRDAGRDARDGAVIDASRADGARDTMADTMADVPTLPDAADAATDAQDARPMPDAPMGVDAGVDLPTRVDSTPDRPAVDAGDARDAAQDVAMDVPMQLDAVADGSRDAETGPTVTCGPFADGGMPADAGGPASPTMSFFVTSQTNPTGNLGGLAGADERCRTLAAAAGVASNQWRAYLSVEHDPPLTGPAVNARDRIGFGPWYNARGVMVASNLTTLHERSGDASVFLDERGEMIAGQWTSSPTPIEHDILTGSNLDGTVAWGKTCNDWTSELGPPDAGTVDGGSYYVARVGHSDGIGPQCSTATSPTNYTSWNSSHDNAGCNDTVPRGGSGRIYCFRAQ